MRKTTPYFKDLSKKIAEYGGLFNAHLHLDRSGTYNQTIDLISKEITGEGSSLSLSHKHAIIPTVHASSMYEYCELKKRVSDVLESMVLAGTRRADTLVDVTTDCVKFSALNAMLELKHEFVSDLDLRLGAYSPLGFRDDEPERWSLIQEGLKHADFLGLLPERDDTNNYPEHIGFDECCRRGILLAYESGKDIHIHTDQANHQFENGSERVLDIVSELSLLPKGIEPFIWLIHVISPSTYEETRFQRLATSLAEWRIGVICCPSAALSMRQLRTLKSPTYNSIARILDLLNAGVIIRLGSDNICDITSPMGTPDLMDEVFVLANAMRFYNQDILAKIASGIHLNSYDLALISQHIESDRKIIDETVANINVR